MFLLIECIFTVLAALLALSSPRLGERWFVPFENGFRTLACRRHLSVLAVGILALGGRLLLLPILPIPAPAVHDEFSYLLAGDTFAHGRLANPVHPMWMHFETFHVNQKPAYVSMYYPAQGAFLAAGEVLFGHPYWGVWLSTGLMCAGICWMLQGWLSPSWALLGGVLAVIRIGTFSYWMNSYWGGSVAALGGALVLGSLPRIMRHQRLRDAVLMGFGFAIVANSRPYEGIFLAIPVIVALLICMSSTRKRAKNAPAPRVLVLHIAAPLLVICALTLGVMGGYFTRTAGSPFRTPYVINNTTYRAAPLFPWQAMKDIPVYRHAAMRDFYTGWAMRQFEFAHSHPFVLLLLKAGMFWYFFIGPLFTLPFFMLCFALPYGISFRDLGRKTQFLFIICGSLLLAAALPVCFDPHYIAPITCAIYGLIMLAMRRLKGWHPWGRPSGTALVRATAVIAVSMLFLRMALPSWAVSDSPVSSWCTPAIVNTYRSEIASQLMKTSGNHLVMVRYTPGHVPINEWVYNGADVDGSKTVWARDMGAEQNMELIHYFKDRKVWLVEPDKVPPQLLPYFPTQVSASDPTAPATGTQ